MKIIPLMKKVLKEFFGERSEESGDYCRIGDFLFLYLSSLIPSVLPSSGEADWPADQDQGKQAKQIGWKINCPSSGLNQ